MAVLKVLNTTQTVKKNGQTDDIINGLLTGVTAAALNLKTFARNNYTGNTQGYLKKIVETLRTFVTYQKDDFKNQDIKFPGRLLAEKKGDCKSLSLFAAGALTAAGIKNGFRFTAYRPGEPTHVYNYYYDENGRKIFFDLCIKDLQQTPYLKAIDMDVRYLAGPEIGRRSKAERKAERAERKENRKERKQETAGMTRKEKRQYKKEKRRSGQGDKRRPVKRVLLAPARTAFLELVKYNFRNLVRKITDADKRKPGSAKSFWNRLGGDYNKLTFAMKQGATRQPFLGEAEDFRPYKFSNGAVKVLYLPKYKRAYVGAPPAPPVDPATLSALVGSAAAILKPLVEFLKKRGVKDDDTAAIEDLPAVEEAAPLGEGFEATDPDNDKDAQKASKGSGGGGGGGGLMDFVKENPLLVGGATAAALYVATKK